MHDRVIFDILIFYFLLITNQKTNFMFLTQENFSTLMIKNINVDKNKKNEIKVLLVDKGNEKKVLDVLDIVYFKSDRNYIDVHYNKNVYIIRKTLKEIQSQLPKTFVQVHRSFIINIKKVKGIVSTSKKHYVIKMENNEELIISPTYQNTFKNIWLNEK